MVKKILVICTGNTCRSPMAAALLQAAIQKHPDLKTSGIDVRSAGTGRGDETTPSAGAIAAMDRYGIDLQTHRPTQVTGELIAWADVILTMGANHATAILKMSPDAKRRTHLIREFAGTTGPIEDPYAQNQAAYDACAAQLASLMPAIVERLSVHMLPAVTCPSRGRPVEGSAYQGDRPPTATSYETCLRRCDDCGVAFSNRNTHRCDELTLIYRDPFRGLPTFLREGWEEMLSATLNERSRDTKRERFGFTTSEDHVTWTFFRLLQTRHALRAALAAVGVVSSQETAKEPAVLLWGAPVPPTPEGAELRRRIAEVSDRLKESPEGRSEPDIVLVSEEGIVLIEVKHRSENAVEKEDYGGWGRYLQDTDAFQLPDQVQKTSGLYELARCWRVGWELAGDAPMTLVNLGPPPLFAAPESKARLGAFAQGIRRDANHRFLQVTWRDFLKGIPDPPEWFQRYCRERQVA